MTVATYKEVLALARQLERGEQLRLLQALLGSVRADVMLEAPQHSIFELKGLGREIWQDIDVDQYIQEERASWDG